jgi:tRNA A37 threonylcarbamoyladenosine modification protein TsaB
MSAINKNFILAFDLVSPNPSVSIRSLGNESQSHSKFLNIQKESLKSRYDSALFINQIIKLCDESSCQAKEITTLAFVSGPGPFSPIRVSTIIARMLFRLNPGLQVYKFNLLSLLFFKLKTENLISEEISSICLKAGLKGYFKEVYKTKEETLIEKAHLVTEVNKNEIIIDSNSEHLNFNFSEFMLQLLESKDLSSFEISSLDYLQPDYLREASVTEKKSPISKA